MLRFESNNLLIDFENQDKSRNWYCTDSKKNAIYKDNIEYNFNSLGYRTKEIQDLDKDFILTTGCSYTEGVGLPQHKIWCNTLADKLDLDLFNIGKSATGPDIVYLNTIQYILCNFPKPKLVVIQWPNNTRKSFGYKDTENTVRLTDRNIGSSFFDSLCFNKFETMDTKWYENRYIAEDGETTINNYTHYCVTNLLWKTHGVPVFNWTWSGDFEPTHVFNDLYIHNNQNNDYARDGQHDGPLIHQEVAETLYNKLKNIISI